MSVTETWVEPNTLSLALDELMTVSIYESILSDILYADRKAEPSLTNKSGSSVGVGDVVVIDTANNSAFVTTTTSGHAGMIGVAKETIANNSAGRIGFIGICSINVTGAVNLGDYLETSTVAGKAKSAGTKKTATAFAIALTAASGGVCTALVFAGGGIPSLSGSGVHLHLPYVGMNNTLSDNPGVANTVYCAKVIIPARITVSALSFYVGTGVASQYAALALYSADGNTKLLDTGAVSVASSGVKTVTFGTPVTLEPGMYWYAWTCTSTGVAWRAAYYATSSSNELAIMNAGTVHSGTAANTSSAGVMPSTLGTITGGQTLPVACKLQG